MKWKKGFHFSITSLIVSVVCLTGCSPGSDSGQAAQTDEAAGTTAKPAAGPVKVEAFVNAGSVKMPQPDQDIIKKGSTASWAST